MNTITYTTGGAVAEANAATRNASRATTATTSATAAEGAAENASSPAQVELSTRAQKIQKLNEEFFPAGPSSVRITPDFIERLQEYGLISAREAERLGAESTSPEEEPEGTLGELSSFIDGFVDKLTEENPDDGLIETLENAKSIIDHFDDTRQSASTMPISTVSARIEQYLASERGAALEAADTHALEQLNMALTIADKLSPSAVSSRKINAYLALSGGYG